VKHNNSFLLADTNTNMPSNAINKPMELHNISTETRITKVTGKTGYSSILNRIGGGGKSKKPFLSIA